MRRNDRFHGMGLKVNKINDYPLWSIAAALILVYLSPFVSPYLCYAAFVICICRVIAYSPQIFIGDCVLLLPLAQLFSTPDGMSLQVYLYLFAAIWYLLHGSVRANSSIVWLLLLMIYMIARMQLAIAPYLLSFGPVLLMFVLMPQQDSKTAVRTAKLFCYGVILSSVYALVLRNTWQLEQVLGAEAPAIWGTNIMRFRGLIRDPNYYMTLLVITLGLMLKLRDSRHVSLLNFWLIAVPAVIFGILTYSKTFLLVAILMTGFYILWQFGSRKVIWGCVLTGLSVLGLMFLLLWEGSPLAVVLSRLGSANSLDELTTGRTVVFADYLEIIFHDPLSFLFGQGLAAEGLVKDPHNLYIEIMYYLGAVGLVLYVGLFVAMLRSIHRSTSGIDRSNFFSRYIVLFLVLILFMSLHGMFQLITVGSFMMAYLAILITKKQDDVPVRTEGETEEI